MVASNISRFYLSGGAANSNPALSLGGAKSTKMVGNQGVTQPVNITGVTILEARGNATGSGTLEFVSAASTLAWAAPGKSAGTPVSVGAGGEFMLQDPNKIGGLLVSVTVANLPGGSATDNITISAPTNNLFGALSVSPVESKNRYRCIYAYNSGIDVWRARVGVVTSPTNSLLAVGTDPAGPGGTATTIANENLAPTGVVFSSPMAPLGDYILIGALDPGEACAFWIRLVSKPGIPGDYFDNFRLSVI
jgi:hypothetical protein